MKTAGECARNNWNSINNAKGEERSLRIDWQNNFSNLTQKDFEFYEKYIWNKETEKRLKKFYKKELSDGKRSG